MDGTAMRILYVATDLIMPLVVGYFMHHRHWVSDNIINKVIRFNVICVYTSLSLLSFWVLPLSWNLLLVPVFAFSLPAILKICWTEVPSSPVPCSPTWAH